MNAMTATEQELGRLTCVIADALVAANGDAFAAPFACITVGLMLGRAAGELSDEARLRIGGALVTALRDLCPELVMDLPAAPRPH